MSRKIAVITGPTATGKTALGVALAKKLGGEIVSADSMQVYQYMDIGTAKPTQEEMAGVRHHMIGVVSPFETYSVARYVPEATACVEDILSRGKIPIVVGGTGLYIESLISGRDFADQGDDGLRQELSVRYDQLGGAALLEELRCVDPNSGDKLHANDKRRIIRALEIYSLTGMTISEHDALTKRTPPRYDAHIIGLSYKDRAELYNRINLRVDAMFSNGLEDEVRRLLEMGLGREHTAMQAIGYKEMLGVILENKDILEAKETIKMESRRYAKRQLSWFRRDSTIRWILWDKEPDFVNGLQISTDYLE